MSIIQYILESLMSEDQAAAKRIANDENSRFSMDDLEQLKKVIPNNLYSKSLGWIATNWDDLGMYRKDIGEFITTFYEYSGRKNINLKSNINDYKDGYEFIKEIMRVIKGKSLIPRNPKIKSKDAYTTLWESEDKSIEVVIPQTKSASIAKGTHSKWCTSANTNSEVDYDSSHMFCKYVLEQKGLMVLVINNNIDDEFYKSAIRLRENRHDNTPEIVEIRDIHNANNYKGDIGFGWNAEYDEYLKEWGIPLEQLFENINIEIDNLDSERAVHTLESQFLNCVRDEFFECLDRIVNDGYSPNVNALHIALHSDSLEDMDMLDYLLQYKSVKPNDDTINVLASEMDEEELYTEVLEKLPNIKYKKAIYTEHVQLIDFLYDDFVKHGVKPNSEALNIAISNSKEKYRELLSMGAKPNNTTIALLLKMGGSAYVEVEHFLETMVLDNDDEDTPIHEILKNAISNKHSRKFAKSILKNAKMSINILSTIFSADGDDDLINTAIDIMMNIKNEDVQLGREYDSRYLWFNIFQHKPSIPDETILKMIDAYNGDINHISIPALQYGSIEAYKYVIDKGADVPNRNVILRFMRSHRESNELHHVRDFEEKLDYIISMPEVKQYDRYEDDIKDVYDEVINTMHDIRNSKIDTDTLDTSDF